MPGAAARWAALALAVECDAEGAGVCLLALRAQRSAPSIEERQAELRAWGDQHAALKAALSAHQPVAAPGDSARSDTAFLRDWHGPGPGASGEHGLQLLGTQRQPADDAHELPAGWLDAFVQKQDSSTDACSAKVLEAKRTMDGVGSKVLALSETVEGNEAIIEANTQLIRDALRGKGTNDDKMQAALKACEDQHADDLAKNKRFDRELAELDAIAEPGVRSTIAKDMDAKAEARQAVQAFKAQRANASASTSLAQERDAGRHANQTAPTLAELAQCTKLKAFLEVSPGAAAPNCNVTREDLQREYTTAYIELVRLRDQGIKLADDQLDICKQAASDEHLGRDSTIDERLQKATKNVQAAKDTISALQPLLDTAKDEIARLEKHLHSLKTTCKVDSQVTEHLKKVRLLIESLNRCPGRNDFQLVLPAGA